MDNCKLKSPFTLLMAGPSSCGKSYLLERLIKRWADVLEHKPTKIYICHAHDQPIYDTIKKNAPCPVELINSLPSDLETEKGSLLVIDDLVAEFSKEIKEWHVRKSHHFSTDVLTISQNLFEKVKEYRTISLNSHYIVLFKNPRDNSQIIHFAKQYSPTDIHFVINSFRDCTEKPHSYMLFDLKQSTPNLYRVRTSIFPSEAAVYVPKSTLISVYDGVESCSKKPSYIATLGQVKAKASPANLKKRK